MSHIIERMCLFRSLILFGWWWFLMLEIATIIALISLLKGISILIATWLASTLPLIRLISSTFHLLAISCFHLCIFFYHIDHLVWDTQILDCAASDIAFGHTPKSITILNNNTKIDYFSIAANINAFHIPLMYRSLHAD